jgi:hypothetical protein
MKTVLVCFFDNVTKSRLTPLIAGSYANLAGEKFIDNPCFSAFFSFLQRPTLPP